MIVGTRNPLVHFTLVELLIIVAILCVLAALLLPSLRGAIETARQVSCANNLNQLGKTLHYYADDHNGFIMPVANTWSPPDWPVSSWVVFSMRYTLAGDPATFNVGSGTITISNQDYGTFSGLYSCPSCYTRAPQAFNVRNHCQYALSRNNGIATQRTTPTSTYYDKYYGRLPHVKSPSQKGQIGEGSPAYVGTGYSVQTDFWSWSNGLRHMHAVPDSPGNATNYKNAQIIGIGNVAYADGHVGAINYGLFSGGSGSGSNWKRLYDLSVQ